MEDFSAIIWVVIFGAAMLFSAVSKARKGQQQAGETNPHEAWPTTLFGEPENEVQTPESAPSPYEKADGQHPVDAEAPRERTETHRMQSHMQSNRQRASNTEITTTRPEKYADFAAEVPEEYDAISQADEPGDALIDPHTETEVAKSAIEKFDLRKAVIYSEILKPKFDE